MTGFNTTAVKRNNHGVASVESAALTTQKELFDLWEYAGYRDILKEVSQVLRQIRALHESYKALNKTPVTIRHTDSIKKKLSLFNCSLDGLFDIALEHLKSSNLITKEDQDFLKKTLEKDYLIHSRPQNTRCSPEEAC